MPSNAGDAMVEIPPPSRPERRLSREGMLLVAASLVIALAAVTVTTAPRRPALEWSPGFAPSESMNLDSMVAVNGRFTLLSGVTPEGIRLWWQEESAGWRSLILDHAFSQLSHADGDLVAYDTSQGTVLRPTEEGWVTVSHLVFPDEIRSRRRSGRQAILGREGTMVMMSIYGDVWWTDDGVEFIEVITDPAWGQGTEQPFRSACRPPARSSPDVPPLVATDDGFVALTSGNPDEPFGIWPVCQPVAWHSPDGLEWSRTDTDLGDGGYVYDMAWHGGRLTAVGGFGIGESVAWTSTDGRTWEPLPALSGDEVDLFTVSAGPAGWVVLGRAGDDGRAVGWTSSDGLCWDPLPEEVAGTDAVVGGATVLVFDRATYPMVWTGAPAGSAGSCH